MSPRNIDPDLAGYFSHEAKQAKYFRVAGVCAGLLMSSMFLYSPPESVIALIDSEAPVAFEQRAELSQSLMRLCVDIGIYAALPLAFFAFSALGKNRIHRLNRILKNSRPIGIEAIFKFVERDDGYEPMVEVVSATEPVPLSLPSSFRVGDPRISCGDIDLNSILEKKLPAQGHFDPQHGVFAAIRMENILLIGEYGDG